MLKPSVLGKRKPSPISNVSLELSRHRANIAEESKESGICRWTGQPFSARYYRILEKRKDLPVWDARAKFLKMMDENNIIVMVGETGSGKTTQIPQFLLDAGYAKNRTAIACTQPRKVAATSVAKRVSEESDVTLGGTVGYKIRFDDKTSPDTKLIYMTDGMLLRQAMNDNMLKKYSVIILDEAHERTVATDVLMALLKDVVKNRQQSDHPLKLVVMSATLDAEKFQKYYDNAPLLQVPGRTHKVDVFFSKEPEKDYVEAAVRTCIQIHMREPCPGDILVFLTGQQEIEDTCKRLDREFRKLSNQFGYVNVLPLYSALPGDKQQRIFDPPPQDSNGKIGRKVIVSTNIAETSLTIDGVVYVVDPGFAKQKIYNPRVRVESLLVTPISKASAKQRAGRAGRTKPGKCFCLYTEHSYKTQLHESSFPEILRSNLSHVVLTLLKLGIKDLVHFDLMDPPAPETLMRALELLHFLGALDSNGNLTKTGEEMALFPLDPMLAKMLIQSKKYRCTNEILSVVSLLSVPGVFIRPPEEKEYADAAHSQFSHGHGDHTTQLTVFNAYMQQPESQRINFCKKNFLNHRSLRQAERIRRQLESSVSQLNYDLTPLKTDGNYFDTIRKCILEGYFSNVAHLTKNRLYKTYKDEIDVKLHPSCHLKHDPEWVMYNEFVLTSQQFIRTVTAIDGSWLIDVAPHYFNLATLRNGTTKESLKVLWANHKANRYT